MKTTIRVIPHEVINGQLIRLYGFMAGADLLSDPLGSFQLNRWKGRRGGRNADRLLVELVVRNFQNEGAVDPPE